MHGNQIRHDAHNGRVPWCAVCRPDRRGSRESVEGHDHSWLDLIDDPDHPPVDAGEQRPLEHTDGPFGVRRPVYGAPHPRRTTGHRAIEPGDPAHEPRRAAAAERVAQDGGEPPRVNQFESIDDRLRRAAVPAPGVGHEEQQRYPGVTVRYPGGSVRSPGGMAMVPQRWRSR